MAVPHSVNEEMTAADAHPDWDDSYAGGPPPWDIGRPQPAFVRLAEAGALKGAVLDAGCGTGEHAMLAARHGARAVGIDVSRRAIEIARRKAAERGIDVGFQVLDALHLDTLGETFETIVDSRLFHIFDQAVRVHYLTAVHDVLRTGGHLHLMCFSDRQPGDWGPHRVTEAELRAAFSSGWRIDILAPTASTSIRGSALPPPKPGSQMSSVSRPADTSDTRTTAKSSHSLAPGRTTGRLPVDVSASTAHRGEAGLG
jgi:SAM-dependent methyltransferase